MLSRGGTESKMKYSEYLDKVKACWLGKNIGGTLGMPFESHRGTFDVEYYTHDLENGVLPNDDLDMQLVWLNAAEKYKTAVDSEVLSTYWQLCVVAYWSEYGGGKNNMDLGILPPASGSFNNPFSESCGCFIRSEIWACLCPGHPELAVRYAYEDACCDHSGEGIYAELFCAALQSAAFVESDPDTLIDIALGYIPKDCAVARVIALVRRCYADGLDWKTTRKKVLCEVPCTFGLRYDDYEEGIPEAKLGYDAPCNIGLMILSWIFGENDFSKSVCIAAGCGEDADCTAGTLAATLGIINGTKNIDRKWTDPIGDEIKTVAVSKANATLIRIPDTVSELTQRVAKLMPVFLSEYISVSEDGQLTIPAPESFGKTAWRSGWIEDRDPHWYMFDPQIVSKGENAAMTAYVKADGLNIASGTEKELTVVLANKTHALWATVALDLPEELGGRKEIPCWVNDFTGGTSFNEYRMKIPAGELTKPYYDIGVTVKINGMPSRIWLPLVLVNRSGQM